MSRFKKLTHVIWHCQYHLVWVPKYRYRILKGEIGREVQNCVEVYCSRLRCEIEELNVQADHVHLLVSVPPKVSISQLMGVVKGKSALRVFTRFPHLQKRPYRGNHFWAKGYCVDTVGLDVEMIRKYVKSIRRSRSGNNRAWNWSEMKNRARTQLARLLRGLASPLLGGANTILRSKNADFYLPPLPCVNPTPTTW